MEPITSGISPNSWLSKRRRAASLIMEAIASGRLPDSQMVGRSLPHEDFSPLARKGLDSRGDEARHSCGRIPHFVSLCMLSGFFDICRVNSFVRLDQHRSEGPQHCRRSRIFDRPTTQSASLGLGLGPGHDSPGDSANQNLSFNTAKDFDSFWQVGR